MAKQTGTNEWLEAILVVPSAPAVFIKPPFRPAYRGKGRDEQGRKGNLMGLAPLPPHSLLTAPLFWESHRPTLPSPPPFFTTLAPSGQGLLSGCGRQRPRSAPHFRHHKPLLLSRPQQTCSGDTNGGSQDSGLEVEMTRKLFIYQSAGGEKNA